MVWFVFWKYKDSPEYQDTGNESKASDILTTFRIQFGPAKEEYMYTKRQMPPTQLRYPNQPICSRRLPAQQPVIQLHSTRNNL
ncbi:hypothetical protein B0H67DRAFT_193339 [Lasiosphaeris hirsuta]|uniref:Uncharacterized protein n=1 Tax=Lasiosphaeris hirsuta TaxID=260670 RepID=A0AA40ARC3_9PEZI|nr:hypothetical protein B0H67DRAFT_193339 [Lasiosphaeris hirsuta]